MSIVEEKYDKLAIKAAITKVKKGQLSPYIVKQYEAVKQEYPDFASDCTLERFAAMLANWNAGKEGIGEQAQIDAITEICPTFSELNKSGKGSIFLYDEGEIVIRRNSKICKKTNIDGVKTFDGINVLDDLVELFVLKTLDIGSFSTSKGGGHQKNVETEIKTVLKKIVGHTFIFDNKPVKFVIMIDGRSAPDVINTYKPMIISDDIRIGTFEDLFGDNK